MIAMAKEFGQAAQKGTNLGLSLDELAFLTPYPQMRHPCVSSEDPVLKALAQELTKVLKASAAVDWSKRDSVRAAMRMKVKIILSHYKYPPDNAAAAVDMVLKQAVVLSEDWSG
jgi:type I restriction enzyme R subunit